MKPFSQIEYVRPDLEGMLAQLDELTARAAAAASGEELLAVCTEYDKLNKQFMTDSSLCYVRYSINTQDEFYAKENDYYDENSPRFNDKSLVFARAVLANPHKQALADRWGQIYLDKLELGVRCAVPEILPLMQQENALVSQYQKLYASAMVEFDGQTMPLPKLGPYKQSTDRAVRKAALEAEGKFFDEHQAEFDELYTKLIENRNAQARAMGYENYVPLSYLRMQRLGYGRAEVEAYREQVVRDVVPLVAKIQARRAARCGLTDPKLYDAALYFADGNPTPTGTPEEILASGRKMYRELSPETAEFIDFMMDNELLDVLSRPGKAPGGYCTALPDLNAPFIFSNFNGTSGDVDVLTHEAGHAFQAYRAFLQDLPGELQSPGMESCEIHSMSMEFLTTPWHHLFFGEQTDKYILSHAEDALIFLPYGCMVDEFQHIVYSHPELTPAQRNEEWLKLEKKYRPWNDMEGIPFYGRGAGWQRQLHIYLYPFYYIDYCLAQTVALQFFAAYLKDPKDAWQRYLALVDKAGTRTYAGLVESAGLVVPFTDGSLAPVAKTVSDWIDAHQL